ncbi:MAG: hypothetical protein DHS20C01_31160 [marine bacterium B5-7]|nr:MAG: hypothetical protein DHS20C01_31160 [marine bacterium B5-7]
MRVHSDAAAQDTARSLNARAFTHGSNIWLGPGESQQDTGLMAHEATHVVQQTGSSNTVQRAPATPVGGEGDIAPGFIELKDQAEFKPQDKTGDWLEQRKRKRGKVRMRFGTLAEGTVEVRKKGDDYTFSRQALPLKHPAIQRAGENLPAALMPSLIVSKQRKGKVAGFISLRSSAKSASQGFNAMLKQAPEVMGLAGFDLSKLPDVTNKLESGKLYLGISGGTIRLGGAFSVTSFNLTLVNEAVIFDGGADVSVKGLATGKLTLKRDEKGLITGAVAVALQLPKNFSGNVDVAWDGRAITGMGKVGYQGEKLSGEVTLQLMEKGKALALEQAKKAPPTEGAAAGGGAAKPPAKKKSGKVDYVVFGEGDLTFAFTDWLNGAAHVIVDPKGFVTIIGKITPQKEFELFAQRDYIKKLPKLEARASYGIPVVGNLFIFANIGLSAFAKLGPAKFYKIEVAGTYSTDPEKNKDFSIKGSLNVSAAAGVKLRGEVGAGIEILDHDLKAGGGVDATAGIKGFAEATPIIGYREKGAPGEDKKGEFFIRGDLEIAAQPFFALGGDLFVEVDSPWWSPLPDKRWTWPLGSKEWPLGGSFGFGASVDYVFGSGKAPEITFPPVEFSAEKFTSDMINDKTKPKAAKEPKQGKWKEKNTKATEPPAKTGGPGTGVSLGKGGAPAPGKPPISKEKKNPATPGARTADGKTVKELKDAAQKGKQEAVKAPKGAKGKTTDKGKAKKADPKVKWEKAVAVVKQALAFAEKNGISKKDLDRILNSIRRRKEFGFKKLSARESKEDKAKWVVYGSVNPSGTIVELKKWNENEIPATGLDWQPGGDRTKVATAKPLSLKGRAGSETKRRPGWPKWWKDVERFPDKPDWRRVHLIHALWGPGDKEKNLVPGNTAANSGMLKFESQMKNRTDNREVLWFEVKVTYRDKRSDLLWGDYFPSRLTASLGEYDKSKTGEKGKTVMGPTPIPVKSPPKPGVSVIPTINSDGEPTLVGRLEEEGIKSPHTFVRWLLSNRPYDGRTDLEDKLNAASSRAVMARRNRFLQILDKKPPVLRISETE